MIEEDVTPAVLVTGSSRGIGRAIALRLARDGFDVVVHCRNGVEQAQEVVAEIETQGRHARMLCFDVSDRNACAQVLAADIEANGAYYGVVANAGMARDAAFPAMTGDEWDSVMESNLTAFYNVLHPIVMPMVRRRRPGRIVTMASVSGIMGNRGQTNYSAAKAGVIAATKSLAVELARRNITVNCVAPGLVDTEMVPTEVMDAALKLIPMCRPGKAEEVASLVSYLMSDDAGYITRQVVSVNGGMIG